MTIRFENTKKDLLYLYLLAIFRLPSMIVIIIVLVANAFLNLDFYREYGLAVYIVFLVLFMLLFMAVVVILQTVLWFFASSAGSQKSVLCSHEIEFGEEGFTERTALNENKYAWAAVTKCRVTGNYILLYVSSSTAHIIPKRYLSDDEIRGLTDILRNRKLMP